MALMEACSEDIIDLVPPLRDCFGATSLIVILRQSRLLIFGAIGFTNDLQNWHCTTSHL
jgi:hypothetical protein